MPQFLVPIITTFAAGLVALLLRYIEKKILKLDADKAATAIQKAQYVSQNPITQGHLTEAEKAIDSLKANLNGSFAKKAKMILLAFLLAATTVQAQRIETVITQSGDSIALQFNCYNDNDDTLYLASTMITIQANYDRCDSGYQVTATTPVISDTAAHSSVPPQCLFSKNQSRFTFYFQQNHRLLLPEHSVTEIARDTIIVPNRLDVCNFNTVFFNSTTNNFISTSVSPGTNTNFIQDWWRFFITQ